MQNQQLFFETFPVGPLACNCCIIGDLSTGRALVVDPGGDAERILQVLRTNNLTLVDIIHTHAHLDHILAAGVLKEATQAKLAIHPEDLYLWDSVALQCQAFGIPFDKPLPPPDNWLHDDTPLSCCDGVTLHTPGHTPGSISFWFQNHKLLIAGDTLFRRSIGRTDLPGGDFKRITSSITQRLYTLDEDATVITGHGEATTIGEELRENPFIRG